MFTKKFLVSSLMAAGLLGAAALPLPSIAAVEVYVNTAPPPPRHERVPDARRGYVWAPGLLELAGQSARLGERALGQRAPRLFVSRERMGRARRALEAAPQRLGP